MPRRALPPLPGPHDPDSLACHMERFLSALAVRNFSAHTIIDRRHGLSSFILWCAERGLERPHGVTKPVLERYQRHLYYRRKPNGEPLSFRTQAQRLVPVRAWFKWLARENYILSNSASELELPRPEKRLPALVLTAEEVEAIMAVPDVTAPLGLRDRAIMEVLYATATRRSELTNLKLLDVALSGKLVQIGYGLYAKAAVSPFSGKPAPLIGIRRLAAEALGRLGKAVEMSSLDQAYNSGRSTQVPTGRILAVKDRVRRRIGYDGNYVVLERT